MRVAIYIRVSTDEQADDGNSLDEQQQRLEAYCVSQGWGKPTLYADEGYSAKNLNRPFMKKLLADVQENKFDIVLTTKIDRFCRNLLDLLRTVELFNIHGCSYVSATEKFDTSTAVGRMTMQLLGTFAEFERERISERVTDNMISLARKTDLALTRPCYGYDVVNGRYEILEDEAVHIRKMFDLAEEGHGHRMIAKIMNELGSRTKQQKLWDQTNIKRLMKNHTIAGTRIHNMRKRENGKTVIRDQSEWIISENNHPAIIPKERFDRIQNVFKSRSRARKHADSETYLLTGIVKCKHCGRNMKGSTSRVKQGDRRYIYHRYICSSYVSGYGCKHHAVHRDPFEETIIKEIERIASASKAELKLTVVSSSITDEIAILKDKLVRIAAKMQRHIEAYEDDLITKEDLKRASVRVQEERNWLQERIKELESKEAETNKVQKKATGSMAVIKGEDRIKAKATLRELIHSVEIENGENIEITWLL